VTVERDVYRDGERGRDMEREIQRC
jgi:hypothetical protein